MKPNAAAPSTATPIQIEAVITRGTFTPNALSTRRRAEARKRGDQRFNFRVARKHTGSGPARPSGEQEERHRLREMSWGRGLDQPIRDAASAVRGVLRAPQAASRGAARRDVAAARRFR